MQFKVYLSAKYYDFYKAITPLLGKIHNIFTYTCTKTNQTKIPDNTKTKINLHMALKGACMHFFLTT